MNKKWTHKVVKVARGMDGKWFDFPTAGTFGTELEARAYAARFASEQRAAGVSGTRITVRARKAARGVTGMLIHTVHSEVV